MPVRLCTGAPLRVSTMSSLPKPVLHLLLNGYSVVLITPHYLLRPLLQQPLDHGVPACKVLLVVFSPLRLHEVEGGERGWSFFSK